MKGNRLLKFKIFINEVLNQVANYIIQFYKMFSSNKHLLKRNKSLKNILQNQSAVIVANGPSVSEIDLKLLKGKNLFFMNRGFKHKDYEYLQPNFHFIIDEKLNSGIWPISFIDTIFELNPNVKLFLNHKWCNEEKFNKFSKKYPNQIFWIDTRLFFTRFYNNRKIDLTKVTYGNAVSGAALSSAIYMGSNNISFIGQDLNGLCYELINDRSHFYGSNKENSLKSINDITEDLLSMSISIRNWINFINYCKQKKININTLSQKGLFSLFVDFKDTI